MNNKTTILSFVLNDSNTWITNHDNRSFMVYQSGELYWTNEISESKKVIAGLYYSGKTWKDVEEHILGYCEKKK